MGQVLCLYCIPIQLIVIVRKRQMHQHEEFVQLVCNVVSTKA